MIAGFVLFDSSDLQAIIEFAVSVQLLGDLNTMVYNATFAALSFANGQADPSQRFYALTNYKNTSLQARGFNQVTYPPFPTLLYTTPCRQPLTPLSQPYYIPPPVANPLSQAFQCNACPHHQLKITVVYQHTL